MTSSRLPVRSPLDLLQLEFPQYRIFMRLIHDRLFCLAEANDPGVQPRFAQAHTAEGLRAKLNVPVRPFSSSTPSIARVWDVLLAGKDNFAADRDQADKLLSVFPRAAELARESRQFQARAVRSVALRGVRQFLDLGCGLPTTPNTHEVAGAVQPEAVVVYVDNDEQVVTRAESVLAKAPGVVPVAGDLSYPDEILYDWHVRRALSFYRPVCVILAMTLHFYDAETARELVRKYTDGLPYGSYVVVSVGSLEGEMAGQFSHEYQAGQVSHHDRVTVASFLDGLELVRPGVVEARAWRNPVSLVNSGRRGHIWAAVGHKAGGLVP
jgi:hypothetical protein